MNDGIIIVFPKLDDAKSIRNLLVRHGYSVNGVCTSGSQALSYADDAGAGIIICGYRLTDMLYSKLYQSMPSEFTMLLLASPRFLAQKEQDEVVCVTMPLKVHDLIDTINMIQGAMIRRRKKRRLQPRSRNSEDRAAINQAKALLMERNHMTEEEAHRYIQKCSMDSGTNMVETAQMIMSIMDA